VNVTVSSRAALRNVGCAPAPQGWTAGHIPDDGFAYHPTALGHQIMANMITKALKRP
jgi:hypothetical protein